MEVPISRMETPSSDVSPHEEKKLTLAELRKLLKRLEEKADQIINKKQYLLGIHKSPPNTNRR